MPALDTADSVFWIRFWRLSVGIFATKFSRLSTDSLGLMVFSISTVAWMSILDI